MTTVRRLLLVGALSVWMAACADAGPTDSDPPGGSGDTGADTDVTPTDTGIDDPRPTETVLVVPTSDGVTLLYPDGQIALQRTWTQLVGSCGSCGGEGASDDGEGLLLAFTTGGSPALPLGGVARVTRNFELDLRVDGFGFPHDAIRDPADGRIIVAETSANRMAWIAGDGSSSTPLQVLGTPTPGFFGLPNGAERIDHDGHTYLLLSHRGSRGAMGVVGGRLTLWDITAPGAPAHRWTFPEEGGLDTPHGAVLRQVDGAWWLLYAHTGGAPTGGSVGLAVTRDPAVRPDYVADLIPGVDVGAFGFLRGVELADDGTLYLTDSGGMGGGSPAGRVIRATWPTLAVPEVPRTGAKGDQQLVDLGEASVLLGGLGAPFEGWLWDRFRQ